MSSLHFDHGDDAATLAAEMLALPEDEALSLATEDGAAHSCTYRIVPTPQTCNFGIDRIGPSL